MVKQQKDAIKLFNKQITEIEKLIKDLINSDPSSKTKSRTYLLNKRD